MTKLNIHCQMLKHYVKLLILLVLTKNTLKHGQHLQAMTKFLIFLKNIHYAVLLYNYLNTDQIIGNYPRYNINFHFQMQIMY